MNKLHKHEYRECEKGNNDISMDKCFYCIHCLRIVHLMIGTVHEVIKLKRIYEQTT